jgi:hypothetical protein
LSSTFISKRKPEATLTSPRQKLAEAIAELQRLEQRVAAAEEALRYDGKAYKGLRLAEAAVHAADKQLAASLANEIDGMTGGPRPAVERSIRLGDDDEADVEVAIDPRMLPSQARDQVTQAAESLADAERVFAAVKQERDMARDQMPAVRSNIDRHVSTIVEQHYQGRRIGAIVNRLSAAQEQVIRDGQLLAALLGPAAENQHHPAGDPRVEMGKIQSRWSIAPEFWETAGTPGPLLLAHKEAVEKLRRDARTELPEV